MYGRKYMGIERATFLIDEERRGARRLAQGQGARPCRRGAGGREGAVTPTLAAAACAVLRAAAPADEGRARRARFAALGAARWRRRGRSRRTSAGAPRPPGTAAARCRRATCRAGATVGSPAGRIALLHALAHIELNAIDLAWDIVARFSRRRSAASFFDDWVGVAAEEAEHFALLRAGSPRSARPMAICRRMTGCGRRRQATAHDLLARLAVVPLVLEARGLDVTPEMIAPAANAPATPRAPRMLDRIYRDEIGHVAVGARWFASLCRERGLDPAATFRDLVSRYFTGTLKPPFNHAARAAADLPREFYEPVAAGA